jgi:hypothetical protein
MTFPFLKILHLYGQDIVNCKLIIRPIQFSDAFLFILAYFQLVQILAQAV